MTCKGRITLGKRARKGSGKFIAVQLQVNLILLSQTTTMTQVGWKRICNLEYPRSSLRPSLAARSRDEPTSKWL